MSKAGETLNQTVEDAGYDKYLNRPFEGLGQASRDWQEKQGSYEDLVDHTENGNIHASAFTTTIAFTSDDYNTVSWAAGVVEYKDGKTTPEIALGNTGNMSGRTYIYYDPQADVNALQTTTDSNVANRGERIVLAIAVNNANTNGKAEIQTFGATGMYISNLTVEHLTSGSIRSKTVTLAVTDGEGDSYFNVGKTDFTNVDSGFILGIDDSDSNKAKFYIGDASNFLNWNGASLSISGTIVIGGASDVYGYLSILNSADAEITRLNENGIILRNTRGIFFEETTAGNYASIAMDGTNVLLIKASETGNDVIVFQDSGGNTYGQWRLNAAGKHLLDLSSLLYLWKGADPAVGDIDDGMMWYSTGDNAIKAKVNNAIVTVQTA